MGYTLSPSANISGSSPYATFATAADLFGANTSAVAASTQAKLSVWAKQVVAAAGNGALNHANVEKLFKIQHDLIFQRNVTVGETISRFAPGYLFSAYWLLLPFSWGSVHLAAEGASQHLVVDPRYLLVDFDLDVQVAMGRLSAAFWNTPPIAALNTGRLAIPGRSEVPPPGSSDAEWAQFTSEASKYFSPMSFEDICLMPSLFLVSC